MTSSYWAGHPAVIGWYPFSWDTLILTQGYFNELIISRESLVEEASDSEQYIRSIRRPATSCRWQCWPRLASRALQLNSNGSLPLDIRWHGRTILCHVGHCHQQIGCMWVDKSITKQQFHLLKYTQRISLLLEISDWNFMFVYILQSELYIWCVWRGIRYTAFVVCCRPFNYIKKQTMVCIQRELFDPTLLHNVSNQHPFPINLLLIVVLQRRVFIIKSLPFSSHATQCRDRG